MVCACAGNAGESFPRHQLQRKPLVSDLGMRDARAVIHVGIANPAHALTAIYVPVKRTVKHHIDYSKLSNRCAHRQGVLIDRVCTFVRYIMMYFSLQCLPHDPRLCLIEELWYYCHRDAYFILACQTRSSAALL